MRIQEADDNAVTTNESAQTTADSRSLVRAKRRGWRLQFGLRTLLVAMLVLGVGGGVLIPWMASAKRQREIVGRLSRLDAKIRYDNGVLMGYQASSATDGPFFWQQIDFWHKVVAVEDVSNFSLSMQLVAELHDLEVLTIDLPPILLEDPPVPLPRLACRRRLKHLTMNGFYPGDVAAIAELEDLTALEITIYPGLDSEFTTLDRLERLTSLHVYGETTDDVIDSWQHIRRLKTLSVVATSFVSGRTLAALIKRNTDLREVELPSVDRSLDICEALVDCPAITKLVLANSDLDNEGLAKLRDLTKLAVLSIHGTQVDGTAFDGVGSFWGLTHLNVSDTQFDDRAAELLAKLPHLRFLDLSETKVADAGCIHLGLSHVAILDLSNNKVTDLGASALRRDLIEELYLTGTDVSPHPFASPSQWPRLKTLVPGKRAENNAELETQQEP